MTHERKQYESNKRTKSVQSSCNAVVQKKRDIFMREQTTIYKQCKRKKSCLKNDPSARRAGHVLCSRKLNVV